MYVIVLDCALGSCSLHFSNKQLIVNYLVCFPPLNVKNVLVKRSWKHSHSDLHLGDHWNPHISEVTQLHHFQVEIEQTDQRHVDSDGCSKWAGIHHHVDITCFYALFRKCMFPFYPEFCPWD